jgi:ribosomal protein S18 acetylase RimI-like enzyme
MNERGPEDTFVIVEAGLADLQEVVDLHCASFDEATHAGMILGRRFVTDMYRWFLESNMAYVLVCRKGGAIVAAISVTDTWYTWPMVKACKWSLLRSVIGRPAMLMNKRLHKRLITALRRKRLGTVSRGCCQVAFTMVLPEARGRGIGLALRREALKKSKERGCRQIITGIEKGNEAMIRISEKLGFRKVTVGDGQEERGYVYMTREL